MTQITSIAHCNDKLDSGLVMLYGAKGDNGMADQILYLTRNDLLTRKFTGMDYDTLAENDDGIEGLVDSDTVVEGYCLVNRKRIAVDLATMPGIAVHVGEVVNETESVFSPFIDLAEDFGDEEAGFDFLVSASKGRCIYTNEVVDVAVDTELDSEFCYTAVIGSEVVRVNAFGYTRHGEVRLEPVMKTDDYEPLTDKVIAQEGTLYLARDAEAAFVSKFVASKVGPTPPSKAIKLKAYSIHHKEDGMLGLAIDLA